MQDGWCGVLDVSAHCRETNTEMKNYICGRFHKGSAMNTIQWRIGFDRTFGILRQYDIFCLASTCQKWKHFSKEILLVMIFLRTSAMPVFLQERANNLLSMSKLRHESLLLLEIDVMPDQTSYQQTSTCMCTIEMKSLSSWVY